MATTKKAKRQATKRVLDAFVKILAALEPLTQEQRERAVKAVEIVVAKD